MSTLQRKIISLLPPIAILGITVAYGWSVLNLAATPPQNSTTISPTAPPKSKLNPYFTNSQLTEITPSPSTQTPVTTDQPSQTRTQNTALKPTPTKSPVLTTAKTPTPFPQSTNSNPLPTPTPPPGWIMHSSERGIRINYPAASYYVNDASDDGINAANFLPNSIALGGFNLPENTLPNTIYQALFSANVGAANDCTKYTTGSNQSTLSQTTTINGTTYYTVTLAATTYGVSTENRIYHTVKNNRCYELVQSVYYSQGSQVPTTIWSTLNTALNSVSYF